MVKTYILGKMYFINCNCYFQDYADIIIEDNVMLGPNVSICTILHPFLPQENCVREIPNSIIYGSRGNYERALPVRIENNVLVYPGAIICPGVTIGAGTVIGAGSIVTHDIPSGVLAYGSPCKTVRPITEEDRVLREIK